MKPAVTVSFLLAIITEAKQRVYLDRGSYYVIKDEQSTSILRSSAAICLLRCLGLRVGLTTPMMLTGSNAKAGLYVDPKTLWIYMPLKTVDFLYDIYQGRNLDVLV